MFTNSNKVKTPPPSFYGLETAGEVAHHLMNIDFEYDPAQTAIAVSFGVSYDEVESLPGYVPGAMDSTPQGVVTGIVLLSQSVTPKNGEARFSMLVNIPKDANGRSKVLAHPENFREGLWIIVAGSKKEPRIHIFEDGNEITADGIPTYGKGMSRVSFAITTYSNDIDGEQLLAWQQERRDNRKAA